MAALLAILAIGVGLTSWLPLDLRFEERLAIGGVVGMVSVGLASFVGFQLSGMHASTLAFGLIVAGSPAASGWWFRRQQLRDEAALAWHRMRLPWRDGRSLRPLLLFTSACAAVSTRVLALGYQTTSDGLRVGHLSTYADWAAHLAYSGSFAYGDNRMLESPIAAGNPLQYHFLANFLGGLFTTTGVGLTTALVTTTWFFAVLMPVLMWCVVMRVVRSRATAALAVVLFTLTGGIGAWYFLQDVRAEGVGIITHLPRMYSRITEQHLWLDNTISASLYAQRSTQLGLCMGLAALLILLVARPARHRSAFAIAGVLIGVTGISWVHMLVSAIGLAVFACLATLRSRTGEWRLWLWFLVPAIVIGAPLALSISPDRNSLRWDVGWMAPAADQPWIVFWLRNAALLLPLFAGISMFGGVPHRLRTLSAPFWLWFVVPNLIAFHPWNWNNTKFFIFWQWAGSIVVAAWIVEIARARARRPALRIAGASAASLLVVSLTVTGALDTLRAMQRSSAIDWTDADDVAAAEWLRDEAEVGERLVYGATNTSAVAALSGVPALSGYPGWTDDLGMDDWYERWQASDAILRGDPGAGELVQRYGIDYVVIGPRERAESGADDDYWERFGTLVFELGDHRIYRT